MAVCSSHDSYSLSHILIIQTLKWEWWVCSIIFVRLLPISMIHFPTCPYLCIHLIIYAFGTNDTYFIGWKRMHIFEQSRKQSLRARSRITKIVGCFIHVDELNPLSLQIYTRCTRKTTKRGRWKSERWTITENNSFIVSFPVEQIEKKYYYEKSA